MLEDLMSGKPASNVGYRNKRYRYRCPAKHNEVEGLTTAEPFQLDGRTLVVAVRCVCGGVHLLDWSSGDVTARQGWLMQSA
jgi:hypothetical protein